MKVSVCTTTYNHQSYIEQTIESVLAQKTDFDVELVIGDDGSRDGTQAKLADFRRRFPGQVILLGAEQHLGMQGNFARTYAACTGDYVALLDGDDYWMAPHKLQRQVDFMRANPTLAGCFCRTVATSDEPGSQTYSIPYATYCAPTATVADLLVYNCIAACSVMYRSGLVTRLPAWVTALSMSDWPLHVLTALHGDFGFIDEPMCVYRLHGANTHSGRDLASRLEMIVEFYNTIGRHLGGQLESLVNEMRAHTYQRLAYAHLRQAHFGQAVRSMRRSLLSTPFSLHWKSKRLAGGWRKLLLAATGWPVDL